MRDESTEKSFEATPQKREEARKQGNFARSREAGAVAGTAALLGVLAAERESLVHALRGLFARTLGEADAVTSVGFGAALRASTGEIVALLAPALLASAAAAAFLGIAQARFAFDLGLVSFKPDRLNPIPRFGDMFSPKKAVVETGMAILKVATIGVVAYIAVRGELPALREAANLPLSASSSQLWASAGKVVGALVFALGVLAAIEFGHSYFKVEGDLKMSRKEIMDEQKQNDGDPKIKGKIRARARQLARQRSLQSVKEAAVVVTNPTHVAVALRYTDRDAAPIVVSKGHDELALAIRKEARKYGIPILENRPLARALDAEVELGHPVPGKHFAAVARVLAFVFRLKKG